MCDYKKFPVTFRDTYLHLWDTSFTTSPCARRVSFIMIKLEDRFQKHNSFSLLTDLLLYMHKFALFFTNTGILHKQKRFSVHSSVNVQEEQISMPKNLQNLGDKAYFPRAQKLQNTIAQFNTFFILMRVSPLLCKNPVHWISWKHPTPYCMD